MLDVKDGIRLQNVWTFGMQLPLMSMCFRTVSKAIWFLLMQSKTVEQMKCCQKHQCSSVSAWSHVRKAAYCRESLSFIFFRFQEIKNNIYIHMPYSGKTRWQGNGGCIPALIIIFEGEAYCMLVWRWFDASATRVCDECYKPPTGISSVWTEVSPCSTTCN